MGTAEVVPDDPQRPPVTVFRGTAPIAAAVVTFGFLAHKARRGTVGAAEERAFRALNNLPNLLEAPVWLVMQGGSLAAVAVSAALTRRRHPDTAARLALAGTAAWALAKLLKRLVRRGRPADHLSGVTVRGARQSGQGFPSGHAAVATTLAVIASPVLDGDRARLAYAAAVVVGGARQYVGAHLPLDVAGGVALGIATGAIANSNGFEKTTRKTKRRHRVW
jgi:membrane-associated phospholipid phosphatase